MKNVSLLHVMRYFSDDGKVLSMENRSFFKSLSLARLALQKHYSVWYSDYQQKYYFVYRTTTRNRGNRLTEVAFYCYDSNCHLMYAHVIKIVKGHEK